MKNEEEGVLSIFFFRPEFTKWLLHARIVPNVDIPKRNKA